MESANKVRGKKKKGEQPIQGKNIRKMQDSYSIFFTLKRMMKILIERDKPLIGMVIAYTLAAGIYPFFAVFLPKIAIGILEQGGESVVTKLAISLGVYALVAGVAGWLSIYFGQVVDMRIMRLRLHYLSDAMDKLLKMDYKYVEDAKFWEESERALSAGNGNANGIEGIYRKICMLPAQIVSIVGMFFLVGYLNPIILICLCAHVLVTMWVARKQYKKEYATKEERSKAVRKINYYYNTTHDFSYGKDIRIYDMKDRIMKNYDAEIGALRILLTKITKSNYLYKFAALATLLVTNVVMYGILIYQAFHGMPISSFTMYISAITSLMAAMLTLGDTISFVADDGQYVSDFFKLMDRNLIGASGDLKRPEETLEIRFEHVTFRYPGTEQNIFTDLNLTIHKGERLAIVGVNGAGKTTLVKLICGLFEPTEGKIYINDREIREYDKKELYDMMSVVFQDVNIFAFTIKENVACTEENIDEARVREALDKVGLLKKVEGFDKGLDQMMLKIIDEDGTDFSGGERQKLAIARGLYKDANMVIMDEPTAALDALAEAEIYENFSTLIEGKTAVYISHRLASTKFCDKIALFEKDGLKEYGNHDELMAKKGKYYEMFTVQGKYYQEQKRQDTQQATA